MIIAVGQRGKKNVRTSDTGADDDTDDYDRVLTGWDTDRYKTFEMGDRGKGREE